MDKNLDGFLNFKNKKDGKKEMLQRFKEEKEQKKLNHLKNEKAIIIQKNVKNFLTLQKLKTQLLNQSITRFEDSEKILNKLKQVNRDFNMPLKLLNDFIRNFNFICFKLSPKNKLLSQTKKILPYLGFWLQKSFKAEEQSENIYYQFFISLLHGSEERLAQDLLRMPRISKNKDENIQDRSYLNIKKLISNIFKYYQNWPPQLSAAMSEFFDANKLLKLSENNQKKMEQSIELQNQFKNQQIKQNNLINMLKIFEKLFVDKNIVKLCAQMIKNHILYNLLKFQNQEINQQIIDYLKIAAFPINLFINISQQKFQNKKDYDDSYNLYIEFQSNFIFYIFSIPQIEDHLIKLEEVLVVSQNTFSWKNLFQSFLFNNFPNPLDQEQTQIQFKKIFTNQNDDLLYILGNTIAILKLVLNRNVTQINQQNDIYQFKDKINDYFALLSFIQLALNTITPAQLEHILDYTNIVSEKLKSLYKNISILFEYNFAVKLINAVFVIKQDENNKVKLESKDIVFSDSFNPMIAMFVTAIYSRIMVLCYNKKNYRTIKKISLAFAFNQSIQLKLYKYIQSFLGLESYLYNTKPEERNDYLNIMILFIMAYSNQLIITDQEDFFTQMKAIPKEQLPNFIKILINIIADILFIPQNPKEQVLCNFLVEIGSKLLKLLYEYNYILEFLPKDQWLIKKDYVEELLVEFKEMHFQRLYIVKIIPFGFKFEDRINLLSSLISYKKLQNNIAYKIIIRRDNIFEDGYQAFTQLNQLNLHGKIAVFYIDEMGVEETGIDAGGIFKEFLTDLSKIVFDPNYGMFKLQENNQQLYPSPFSQQLLGSDHLNIFYFLGQVIGRGIYDNILLPAIFSKFFLRSILGKQNHLIELQSLDKELYKNLKYLKDYKGDATDLGLNFTVHNSQEQEVELIQNGKEIAVDNKNKYKYIYLVAGYKLNNEIQKQIQYFTDGLKKVIDINWLQMFDEEELQLLICGDRKALDVEDLRSNSAYEGYSKNESYIKEFYKILSKFDDKLQYKFIKFVTSCERAPLLGFKNLYPQFTIVRVDAEHDTKLPSSSTCFNRLYLPKYSNNKILQQKLILAIEQGLGFHLA